jgi:hypothetical protein
MTYLDRNNGKTPEQIIWATISNAAKESDQRLVNDVWRRAAIYCYDANGRRYARA